MGFSLWRSLLLATLGLAVTVSCGSDPRPLEEQLQTALDGRLQQCGVKGVSVAVILPDEKVWRGVSGISHGSVKMSPDMSFAVGSITKNMVATLTLQLAEEGKLSLEDPLSHWLPPYPNVDSTITIRQMLGHTSGLFMFWDNQKIWDDLIRYRTKVFTPEEVLSYLEEPYYPPGGGYRYSNTNYLLAAMIITRATGATLGVEMRRRFWDPLGLQSACLPLEEPYPQKMAHVWGQNFEKDGEYRDVTFLPRTSHDSITYGSAGVFMTAEDLARWAHALFNGRVISEASLEQMCNFDETGSHGLGLDLLGWETLGRLRAFGHGGGGIGSTAYMVHLPDHNISLAVMINHFGGDCARRIVKDLSRIAALSVRPESILDMVWSIEGLLSSFWILAGAGMVIFAVRRNRPSMLIPFGGMAIVAGWLSTRIDVPLPLHRIIIPEGIAIALLGIALLLRRSAGKQTRR